MTRERVLRGSVSSFSQLQLPGVDKCLRRLDTSRHLRNLAFEFLNILFIFKLIIRLRATQMAQRVPIRKGWNTDVKPGQWGAPMWVNLGRRLGHSDRNDWMVNGHGLLLVGVSGVAWCVRIRGEEIMCGGLHRECFDTYR